jgi:transformation/transcription domain-associated protein
MADNRNLDALEARLQDASSDAKTKIETLTGLRDGLESWCQGSTYAIFLQKFVPIWLNILTAPPVFISTSPEQKIRNCVLEILHRLPMNSAEATEPHCVAIVDKCLELVRTENEDNAVLCLKIIMDFERFHIRALSSRAQPFLDLILELFDSMQQTVHDTFDSAQAKDGSALESTYANSPRPGSPVASTAAAIGTDPGSEQQTTRQLVKGMQSFKVVAECPIIVVSIFQAHRQLAPENVAKFTPRIKAALQLEAGPQKAAHEEARANNTIFTGVAKEIKNRAAFGELVTSQVKTMSFLAYLLRAHQNKLTDFLQELPGIVVRLLQDCPRERSATRKELLVAIRHIINFNFRHIFLPKIIELLDERTLVGDGLTSYETLRPLAYTMLADLIHHVRDQLDSDQIRATVVVYVRNLHDDYPGGTSYQTMSAKLLLNMAECMSKIKDKQDARHYMMLVLNGIADKFAAMNRQYPNAVKLAKQIQPNAGIDAVPENYLADKDSPPEWDEIDIFSATPIKTVNPRDRAQDPVTENKFLFKNLLHGLKTFFYQLRNSNSPKVKEEMDQNNVPVNWPDLSYGFTAEEVNVLIKLFREGTQVFKYYNLEKPEADGSPETLSSMHMASSGKEEKDLLETFATIFHHLDPATFHEVFQSEIPFMYEQSFEHTGLLHIPQFLLASEATSPAFAGMLLQFLMNKIEEVGTRDTLKSSILLRLFKLSFMAVTLFAPQNEQVLLPHVTKLITRSIELSVTAEEPTNYFLLLRSLFRSIGGGRFEHLYKEILPLLEMLLEVLNNLLVSAQKPEQRDLFVELSLTVPARLSHLLPHLSYLMRPLVVALRAGSELIAQGLRTLELCIDNLTADYLDPIMAPVIDELMSALWDHLKPSPYSHFHAHSTMRILGKLGGRNRKFISAPPELPYKAYSDDEPSFDVRLIGAGRPRALPARLGIDVAVDKLRETPKQGSGKASDEHHKKQAFNLITSHIKLLIGSDELPDDLARLVRLQANDTCDKKYDAGSDLFAISEREKSVTKRDDQQETLSKLLKACMLAASIPVLQQEAEAFLQNVYRHFMIIELGTALGIEKHKKRPFDSKDGEGPVFVETGVLADVISDSLASDHGLVREVAERAMRSCKSIATTIFGSEGKAEQLPFFKRLAETFVHACYEEEWFVKSGGTAGISIIISKMDFSDEFLIDRQLDFVRALLYVIKDMPQDLPASIRIQAKETLIAHIKRCATNYKADQLGDKESKIQILCNRVIGEVSHMNKHVRHAAQDALRTIAESVSVELHEVVKPVKDLLLAPIFNKPLRALPFAAQIGYIDAINFCLDMENDVLTFDDPLNRLLYETLALVDAEDDSLAAKPYEHRNSEAIVNLRVACLRLLTTAIRYTAFNTQAQTQHRARIISIFFKSLYSKNKEVAGAANAGLKIVLAATQKLPKDLLQNGLRPILMNVQDPRKLSVEGLEGLRTLLQLLTNYFKVEIGTRLLDHMRTIAEPTILQKVSFTLIEANPKMKVVTAIFSVFHLLPPTAVQFLPDLVDRVLKLEGSLRRTRSSPFREPLIQYLNHYSKEAWAFFSGALKEEAKGRFFAQILANESSNELREKVIAEADNLVGMFPATGEMSDEQAQAAANAVHIAYSVCKFDEQGLRLLGNDNLRKAIFNAAKSLQIADQQNKLSGSLRLAAVQASEQITTIMTLYLQQKPDDLETLFDVLEACATGELPRFPELYAYLYKNVVTNESIEYQRSVMIRCIDVYTNRQSSQSLKWFVFHNVLNPILANDVKRNWDSLFGGSKGTALLDRAMTDQIHNKLWKPQSHSDVADDSTQGVDHSRMELLQTTAFLVKYHHSMLQDARKDIIKFGWNYIRLDDVINKYAAYVSIAYFIANYETPPKIALQVYGALLRAHQPEGKNLVMQSLEILEPVLKKRLGGVDGRQAMWSKLPRRILSEEISNVAQLTSIFHFLVRHPDLFYEAREGFAQTIIPSMNKVAALPNTSSENRKLALNLISLICKWEERTVREQGSLAGVESPTAERAGSPQAQNKRGAAAPAPMRLMLIKYLVQFIATLPERFPVSPSKTVDNPQAGTSSHQPPTDMIVKAIDLLYRLLAPPLWDDLDVDAMFPKVTEQILCGDQKPEEKAEIWTTRIINTIQILKVLLNSRSDEWVTARLPQLQKLLTGPLKNESFEIQEALHGVDLPDDISPRLPPLLQRALEVIPLELPEDELPDAESPTEEFKTFLNTTASDALNNGNHVAGINILWALAQRKSEDIHTHIEALLKTFQTKLAKDHLSSQLPPQAAAAQGLQAQNLPNAQESEVIVNLIIKTIDMLSGCISALVDRRRPYLSVLASLVERSNDNKLCDKILNQVEAWVFAPTEPVPTLKEKTAVLQKMLLFETRPDNTMYTKFMNLVIRIYEDPKIFRSELAVRMEQAFLIGLRSPDIEMRQRFMTIFDRALSRSTSNRFFKLIAEQQWEVLGDSFWLSQIIQLMFGSIDQNTNLHLHQDDFRCLSASRIYGTYKGDPRAAELMLEDSLETLIAGERHFMADIGSVKAKDILVPLSDLQHTDWQLAHDVWVAYFPMCWSVLSKDDKEDIEQGLISLLTKDMHQRQVDKRPNCVSTLLEGIARARPVCKFPPHVMKFLAQNYDAWYTAATFMEEVAINPVIDMPTVKESNLDALTELYARLEESDLFYGTWRRRSQFVETNAALSYEQNGIWDKAQQMYEMAQVKARTGSLPFSQGEYMLWEDQWVQCAQKLQQWEILGDFAKHENINDLYLEAMWRNFEAWNSPEQREQLDSIVKAVSDAPTPRRMFFQAFMSLLKLHNKTETPPDFARVCDENIQLSIKNWHKLPRRITNAHITLLQNFQQLVELHDASVICSSLAQTNATNLDVKSQELKVLLSTWRDRLPNLWDDINAWQDLVTWRQHIFQLINGTYLNLLPASTGNATGNSYAYRGYHETAWIINRFAHVARKHQMPDVCINQLSKIYTLPNIEIQEAFLKLREQAKCHYQNRSELTSGLDVINNTNLNYFGPQQKAEFYTLKGMFLSKLNQKEDAQDAFGTALFFDIKLPKAWAEWGRYSDQLFKEDPNDLELAGNAISCYLEAAGQYKSAKSRKLLSRILWLLSLDDPEGTLAKTYNNFKGETPLWYWVSFIPQLLNNLSRSEGEANISQEILAKLAKTYPQALHFQLRTSHEDMQVIRRGQLQKEQKEKAQKAKQQQQGGEAVKQEGSPARPDSQGASRPSTAVSADQTQPIATTDGTPQDGAGAPNATAGSEPPRPRKPWEHTEALVITLRTAFPLLYASMEAMVEQIQKYFKCPPDEDAYRLIVALLNDALNYISRSPHAFNADSKLPPQTEANITRFAESILPHHIRKSFEQDFVSKKPTMSEYMTKLRKWRDKLAERLDRRPSTFHLDQVPHLSGFRFVWFDEVEVPGQYLQHRDKNQDFIRIERFLPIVDLVRGVASCHRRIKIRGHDGSVHPFAIQHPAPRHSRREERILQLFRMFNATLAKKKESRRRNLQFHLPVMVPLSPQIRMIQDDASYVTLQGVYEDYCRRNDISKDDPTIFTMDKMRSVTASKQDQFPNVRLESLNYIQQRYVPTDLVREYFARTFPSFDAFWLFRRQFSYQMAALTYITYTMYMTHRYPNKLSIARRNGNVWGSELLPYLSTTRPLFHNNNEAVPFRLTPNLQKLMGPIHQEGIFTCALMAIARCLTADSSYSTAAPTTTPGGTSTTATANGTATGSTGGTGTTPQQPTAASSAAPPTAPDNPTSCELSHALSIFIRDELTFWYTTSHRQSLQQNELRENVQRNAEAVVNRALALAREPGANNLPANQSVVDFVAKATNPEKLAQMDLLWMPWL